MYSDNLSLFAYILGDKYYNNYINSQYRNKNIFDKSLFDFNSRIDEELKEIRETLLDYIDLFENDGI